MTESNFLGLNQGQLVEIYCEGCQGPSRVNSVYAPYLDKLRNCPKCRERNADGTFASK